MRSSNEDPLVPLLREKLAAAAIVPEHAMPPDVVTLYSRVRYRIDALPPATRILIHDSAHEVIGATLAVASPRGLALLGLASNQTATLAGSDGAVETICVEAVLYQPEAARSSPHWALT